MHLFYCIAGIATVCHFVRSLMAFVCQEIKGLLTYLLWYTSDWHTQWHNGNTCVSNVNSELLYSTH